MLTEVNYGGLLETAEFIKKLDIHEIWLVFLTPYGSAEVNFEKVVPKYSKVMPFVNQVISWKEKNKNVKIRLEGFPYCLLNPGSRSLVTEEDLTADSLDGLFPSDKLSIYNCKHERQFKQKQKFSFCLKCVYNNKCEGVYKKYSKYFGNKEFKPVS